MCVAVCVAACVAVRAAVITICVGELCMLCPFCFPNKVCILQFVM